MILLEVLVVVGLAFNVATALKVAEMADVETVGCSLAAAHPDADPRSP